MEISNIWSSAKAQIGSAIDKNAEDISSLKEESSDLEEQMLAQDRLYQIGDILNTLRDAPDDSWLKCDGSGISSEDYPELCSTTFGLSNKPYNDKASASYGFDKKSIAYHNGKCLVNRRGSSLLYSSDVSRADWTEITISSSYTYTLYGVKYYNGYWYAWGQSNAKNSSYNYATVWYTTNPTGTWNYRSWTTSGTCLYDIDIYDGELVGVGTGGITSTGTNGGTPIIAYLDISSGIASSASPGATFSFGNGWFTSVVCCNGTWVVGGNTYYLYQRSPNDDTYLLLYTSTAPSTSSGWTSNTSVTKTVLGECFDIAFYGGVCAINGGCYYETSSGYDTNYRPFVLYTTTPSGAWTQKIIPCSYGGCGGCITHNGNEWIVGYMEQNGSTKQLEAWYRTYHDITGSSTGTIWLGDGNPLCIYKGTDGLFIAHVEGTNSSHFPYSESTIICSTRKALPNISLSSECNTYIKAK